MTTCARKNDFIALFCTMTLTFAHILFQMLDYIGVKPTYNQFVTEWFKCIYPTDLDL